ncbi:MAG: glycerol kinase [Fusobacteria bacterium]|nr:MAG: glycerol kinase [Fusobacteriota bacterium]KAF0229322.1 MAG: glycerol [Fusobacteriota bacterium]
MKKYIIALDQGTTSSRALVIDDKKNIIATAQKEIVQIYPKEGYIEHDPLELFDSVIEVMKEAVGNAGIAIKDIAGIGIANQRETTILFNKITGEPVYNAIVWQCKRTIDICRKLEAEGYLDYIKENTGLVIDPYFSGTKIAWILENVEGVRQLANEGNLGFSTVDSWLLYKLTDGEMHKTDMTNASRTMLYNIRELKWDNYLCEALNIPMNILPEVVESSGVFGHYDYDGHMLPIVSMVGDQQAALFGQGCVETGDVKNTYGTGCFLLVNTGEELILSDNGLISTIGISYGGKISYAIEGSVFMGGALFKWMRDELGLFSSNDEIEGIARSVESSSGVVVVPAFTGLGAPYWDMKARGTIFGLTRGISKGHIVRAGIEAVVMQVEDLLAAIRENIDFNFNSLKVDGGACVNNLLLEMQSRTSGLQIIRPDSIESTALGAYYLAGLELGFWSGLEELFSTSTKMVVFDEKVDEDVKNELLANWKKAVAAVRFYASN